QLKAAFNRHFDGPAAIRTHLLQLGMSLDPTNFKRGQEAAFLIETFAYMGYEVTAEAALNLAERAGGRLMASLLGRESAIASEGLLLRGSPHLEGYLRVRGEIGEILGPLGTAQRAGENTCVPKVLEQILGRSRAGKLDPLFELAKAKGGILPSDARAFVRSTF